MAWAAPLNEKTIGHPDKHYFEYASGQTPVQLSRPHMPGTYYMRFLGFRSFETKPFRVYIEPIDGASFPDGEQKKELFGYQYTEGAPPNAPPVLNEMMFQTEVRLTSTDGGQVIPKFILTSDIEGTDEYGIGILIEFKWKPYYPLLALASNICALLQTPFFVRV